MKKEYKVSEIFEYENEYLQVIDGSLSLYSNLCLNCL